MKRTVVFFVALLTIGFHSAHILDNHCGANISKHEQSV